MNGGLEAFVCDTGIKRIMNRNPEFFWGLLFPGLRATLVVPGGDKELVESERTLRGDGSWSAKVEGVGEAAFFWCEAFTRYDKNIAVRVVEYKTGKHREHLSAHKESAAVYAGAVVLTHPPSGASFSLSGMPEIVVPHVVMPCLPVERCLGVEGIAGGALAVLSDERNLAVDKIVERLNAVEDEVQWRSWASIVFGFSAAVKDGKFFRKFMELLQTTAEAEKIRKLKEELAPVLEVLYEMRYEEGLDEGFSQGFSQGFSEGEKKGFSEGEKKGFSEGEKKGFSEGEKTGFSKGELGKSLKLAAKLLERGMSVEEVADLTELDVAKVAAITSDKNPID